MGYGNPRICPHPILHGKEMNMPKALLLNFVVCVITVVIAIMIGTPTLNIISYTAGFVVATATLAFSLSNY